MRAEKGFTLIELLLVLSLLTLVLGGAFTFLIMGMRSYQQGSDQLDLQQNARIALVRINNELRWAKEIVEDNDKWENEISFYHLDDNKKYTFEVVNGKLNFIQGEGSPANNIAYNIDRIEFSQEDDTKTIKVHIYAKHNEREFNISTSVVPRNVK